ncbi:hypothetical protein DICPUDRAFT_92199 [Dictyostelium purpureum]|uniref:Dynacortin n=1 Tax=Dictyostelium purpureum TaxID=5786 RepID=F0ZNE7_DICPU|nr:uncharacterized protein DICPUDRAFT_92199 [Dictyostelium purpureum]EGC34517.1 hypothetical protein DICPUDRAFT_92199 [Dictyostelium purpureum]|eukprot:XP_003288953.1 hypothetical protein DICPUDRAFT_92199 [Dictyostelium purpureum]
MYSPEDLEFREQQRLSKALQGKLGSQTHHSSSRKSWAPVQTKPVHQTPVNTATTQLGSISISDSNPNVDTTSIYPGAIVEEKVKLQEAQRLKKMGLATDENDHISSSSSSSSLNSSTSSMTKSTSNHNIAKETSSSNLLQYQSPTRVAGSISSENLVDNTSIKNNVDSHTSDEKMKQEAKRLERWGLKINTPSTPSPSTTSPAATTPAAPITPTEQSIPTSPFTTSAAVSVNSTHSNLSTASTQQFLDRVVLSAKSVKQIIQKKTSNRDITIAILMDLVKESANFGMNLSADTSMSFEISQNAGKLAGAVNELVKDSNHDNKIYDEILQILGLLYLAVVAN